MQVPSAQKVISLSSAQIEVHDVHSDLNEEDDPATNPEVVMNTLLSSIPNIQGFPSMLGSSSSHQSYSKIIFSRIMRDTTSIPTVLVESPYHTSPPPLLPPHPITTSPIQQLSQDNIPSASMTLPHKEVLPIVDYFTSLTFTSPSSPMNIPPLSIGIPLNQTQTDPLVTIYHQTN